MSHHYVETARRTSIAICLALACGTFTACKDDYTLDDPDNYPSWLGGSIYEAMKHPENLTSGQGNVLKGTFTNYLRLIDDLGYAETLAKTGSKTVFPANDEAFERFYANNSWGVSSYEDLTDAMKKQLLYASMLDNAILVEMLSNISDGSTAVMQGQALKHTTGANVIDTITHLRNRAEIPVNNPYWEKYYDKGIYLVMDATRPMMVHFTEEQMTSNNITTRGDESDFEVITGTPYDEEEQSAYVFRNKIISADVTCKNGYIHQMEDVLVPPGNLAEVIRNNGESDLFSRMLDRFSAPYYDATTTLNYNNYATQNGLPEIDSIFQKRYLSTRSQGGNLTTDPNNNNAQYVLPFDPGWNNYNNGAMGENTSKDIAAMFVPTDEAMKEFFLPGGGGEFLITAFGKKENTEANLEENIDSIPLQNVQQLIGNLMKSSFVGTVPSKFGRVMDEANDPMGLSLDVLAKNSDGSYNVKIANNGVAYMLNTVFAPPSLIAVSAPVTLSSDMRIMNEAVNDGKNRSTLSLNLNYYAYLLAMSANYAFFIPTDDAFGRYYVDPTYLNDAQPRALKFYYDNRSPYVFCSAWKYDKATGTVGTTPADSLGRVSVDQFRTQLVDILNYHTIVLGEGEKLGTNKYYKTKHGGEIRFDGSSVVSGSQIDQGLPTSQITKVYNQANGTAYAVDHVIQAPHRSVLDVLQNDQRFSEFLDLCTDFDMDSIMEFASDKLIEVNTVTKKRRLEAYHPFAAKGGLTDNVNYFNSYNYTVYAPDNEAMQTAYSRGLPRWSDIKKIYDQYNERLDSEKQAGEISEEVQAARDKALAMVEEINSFIRYHFQDNSVYADNVIEEGTYPTASSDTLGIREKLTISGSGGRMTVKDKFGHEIEIDASNSTKLCNQMARDYVIDSRRHNISTSSFAVVHQISTPLSTHEGVDRYDGKWTGTGARERLRAYRRQFDTYLYKRYDAN
ncbi:MAG: fasciclin domain-containing protein [Prevotella sp.]|nr:fasciclin domain-containing protein [Prevotella sp.]